MTLGQKMPVSPYEARKRARDLVARAGISQPPVPVERLAQEWGISIQYIPLDDELSGMAFVKDERRFVVVNAGHHPNRQRFTLAHEMAHHILHYEYLAQGVHVDKVILRRDAISGIGIDTKEIAANAFAAELLMPEALLKPHIRRGLDFNDESVMEALARKFKVSTAALNFRLMTPPPSKQRTLL